MKNFSSNYLIFIVSNFNVNELTDLALTKQTVFIWIRYNGKMNFVPLNLSKSQNMIKIILIIKNLKALEAHKEKKTNTVIHFQGFPANHCLILTVFSCKKTFKFDIWNPLNKRPKFFSFLDFLDGGSL